MAGRLAAALAFVSLGVSAQGQGPASPPDASAAASPDASQVKPERSASVASAPAIHAADQRMMRDIAQANLAEIKMSALATAISQNPSVRTYAETMLNEHYAAKDALQKIADARQVILPHGVNEQQVPVLRKLALTAGPAFDQAYVAAAGIEGHQHSHALFEKAASEAKDPEFKAFAARQLPRIDQHLAMARELTQSPPAQPAPPAANAPR